jgi:hypothetical protein
MEDNRKDSIMCPLDICGDIAISIPVEISAYADVEKIELKCAGHHIERNSDDSRDDPGSDKFVIVQKIHVRIPVRTYAECETKKERIDIDVCECDS